MTAPVTLPLDLIRIGERHRRDMGDVAGLAASMAELGLLQPVVVRPDGTLIAGERRLRAAQLLGWTEIPVTVVDLDDDRARRVRRERRPQGLHALRSRRHQAGAGTDRAGGGEGAAAQGGRSGGKASGKLPEASKGNAADKAAKATGMARTHAGEGRGHRRRRRGRAGEVRQAARRHGPHRPRQRRLSSG